TQVIRFGEEKGCVEEKHIDAWIDFHRHIDQCNAFHAKPRCYSHAAVELIDCPTKGFLGRRVREARGEIIYMLELARRRSLRNEFTHSLRHKILPKQTVSTVRSSAFRRKFVSCIYAELRTPV